MVRPEGSVSSGSSSTQLGRALLSAPILILRWYRLPITLSVKNIMNTVLQNTKCLLHVYTDDTVITETPLIIETVYSTH